MSSIKTLSRMRDRVTKLKGEFAACVQEFNNAGLFTGPSLHFHFMTIGIRNKYQTAVQTLEDDLFFENLYATLTSWGMHRMGPGNTKLRDLREIKESFIGQVSTIQKLQTLRITDLEKSNIDEITSQIWSVMSKLNVGIGSTKIVANSKALHHLLPYLVPPIDRQYTIRFFYGNKSLSQGDEIAFNEIYPNFHEIAITNAEFIADMIGKGMNTSETKVLDNAIVGYVLQYLKYD